MIVAAANSHFSDNVQLLVRLHALIAQGRDDDEADALRDEMDVHWHKLSEQEKTLVSGLSADLYSIGSDRTEPIEEPEQAAWQEFSEAVEQEDWLAVLSLLRCMEEHISPAQTAYIRGACWAYLGQFDAAIAFLLERVRLQPLDDGEEVLLLTCLLQADRIEDAVTRANAIAQRSATAVLLLKAAEVLFVEASQLDDSQSEARHQYATGVALRGLALAEQGSDELVERMKVRTYLHMALSHDQLGHKKEAIKSCEAALKLAPNHSEALMTYGYLTYDQYPNSQRPMFRGNEHRRLVVSLTTLESPASLISAKG